MKDATRELVRKSLESVEQKGDEETKLFNLLSYDPADTRPCMPLYGRVKCS